MRTTIAATLVALLAMVGGCTMGLETGARDVAAQPQSGFYWAQRPVTVVIDSAMRETCVDAALDAVEFWQAQGVNYLHVVSSDAPVPQAGQIVIRAATLDYEDDANVAGECARTADGLKMVSADIRLELCARSTVAHELGHALGLEHRHDDASALMGPNARGFGVSDAERAHVH